MKRTRTIVRSFLLLYVEVWVDVLVMGEIYKPHLSDNLTIDIYVKAASLLSLTISLFTCYIHSASIPISKHILCLSRNIPSVISRFAFINQPHTHSISFSRTPGFIGKKYESMDETMLPYS